MEFILNRLGTWDQDRGPDHGAYFKQTGDLDQTEVDLELILNRPGTGTGPGLTNSSGFIHAQKGLK